jgi:hypothetical protein
VAVIDAYASTPWYLDHVRPIMAALGDRAGRTYMPREPMRGTNPILVVSYGDYATARRMGRTKIALGQHGAGQSYLKDGVPLPNPAYPGGLRQEDVGLFLVPNLTAATVTRWRYPKARIEIVGCPKLDTLPRREGEPGRVVAISTHWPGTAAPEAGSAWSHFGRALLGLSHRYTVLGHAHPRDMPRRSIHYKNAGIEAVPSFEEIARRSDLYICDNSSTLFEFAATGRPVVVLNPPQYRREVRHGLRFWDAASVGVNCDRPEDLAGVVERALELRPDDVAAREAAVDLVYQPRTGGAELAARALLRWTG